MQELVDYSVSLLSLLYNWAVARQNQQNGMCAQWRLGSARASAQSGQSLCCLHEGALVFSYPLSTQRRLWSDWADAQADLSLHWAHWLFCLFCFALAQIFKLLIWFIEIFQTAILLFHFVMSCCFPFILFFEHFLQIETALIIFKISWGSK